MGSADNWRGAALTLPQDLAVSCLITGATGKLESRRLPRITQGDALTERLRSISQWSSQARVIHSWLLDSGSSFFVDLLKN